MRILVIEKDESLRRLVTHLAATKGITDILEFSHVRDARDALDELLASDGLLPTLIVSELQTGGSCDSVEFCQWVNEHVQLEGIPIVIMVGEAIESDMLQKVFAAGAYDAVYKRNAATELLIRLKAAIRYGVVVAERREANEKLQRELTFHEAVVDSLSNMGEGMCVVEKKRFTYVNQALCDMTGYTQEELYSWPDFSVAFYGAERDRILLNHERRLSGQRFETRYPTALRCKDGSRLDVEFAVALFVTSTHNGVAALMRDIRNELAMQNRLREMAHFDQLTGLPNRRLMQDRLMQAFNRGMRANTPFAVLFIDLDGFKAVNDQHGHAIGDELLVEVAVRLRSKLRASDTAARLAGDEFVLILESDMLGELDAENVAKKLLKALRAPYHLSVGDVRVSASIGIALARPNALQSPEELLHDADTAMYRAKQSGKNAYYIVERDAKVT